MSNDTTYIFTDIDLDGVGSLITLHHILNAKPGELKFSTSTVSNLRKTLLKWLETDSFANYTSVYFLDLDTSTCLDLIDKKNVTVIDHHSSHLKSLELYKEAKTIVKETTSCTKWIYYNYKETLSKLTDRQKYFIMLCDDYDSYQFKLSETYDLNCLFTNTHRSMNLDRTHKFLERFYSGFDAFTFQETNIIKDYVTRKNEMIAKIEVFSGVLSINKEPIKVVGSSGEKFTNEVCDHLIKKYSAGISFFYNINSNHVSFRKNKECKVDLSKLAAKLCDGGGHEYAAGGKPTNMFFEFAKTLTTKE